MVLWMACAFGYYLINFEIKYLPGNLYVNVMMSTAAEICAKMFAYSQYERLGLKKSFQLGLTVALLGCLLLLISNGHSDSTTLLGICLFVAKFGVAFTFMINYLSIVMLFPTLFCGTATGMCNFAGRLATIFAPMAAELKPPQPTLILGSLVLSALACSTMLIIPEIKESETSSSKRKKMKSV